MALTNKKIRFSRIFLGLLTIGIVFMSGCVQEKAPIPVPNQSPTVSSATQPSATPTGDVTNVRGAILIVDKSGAGNYTSIQDAINSSNNGDTILVYSGTYYESVDANRRLILRGVDTGGGKPVVNANRSGSSTGAITLSAGNSVLEGFAATGAVYHEFYNSAGIWVNSNDNQIRNNTVSNNPYGIELYHYSGNNILSGNNASHNNYGIYLNSSSNNSIYNNYFSYSRDSYFGDPNYSNHWNTTKTPGINIVGGPYIGGNFWASPGRTGFSQICLDDDNDGICDIPHMLDDNNSDFLPLAYKPDANRAITVLVEDTDFNFSNRCEIQKIPRASGGSLLACIKAGGEKINVTFTGTSVLVLYFGSPNGGIVKVQIDGKEYPEIGMLVIEETEPRTLESTLRVKKQIAGNLQNTSHILTFEIANESNPQSGMVNITRKGNPDEAGDIYIDAIEIKKE